MAEPDNAFETLLARIRPSGRMPKATRKALKLMGYTGRKIGRGSVKNARAWLREQADNEDAVRAAFKGEYDIPDWAGYENWKQDQQAQIASI
jgi:hypothetical protein